MCFARKKFAQRESGLLGALAPAFVGGCWLQPSLLRQYCYINSCRSLCEWKRLGTFQESLWSFAGTVSGPVWHWSEIAGWWVLRWSCLGANSTRAVLRRHSSVAFKHLEKLLDQKGVVREEAIQAEELLQIATTLARRLQLLIENVSVTLLLNFYIAQLEHNGRSVGLNLVQELYGVANSLRVVFHEIPGKRWDALTYLLDPLGVSDIALRMAEVGVEAANTSQRLLERNPFLSYIGVDPYFRNDLLYADVVQWLAFFIDSGRFTLYRK